MVVFRYSNDPKLYHAIVHFIPIDVLRTVHRKFLLKQQMLFFSPLLFVWNQKCFFFSQPLDKQWTQSARSMYSLVSQKRYPLDRILFLLCWPSSFGFCALRLTFVCHSMFTSAEYDIHFWLRFIDIGILWAAVCHHCQTGLIFCTQLFDSWYRVFHSIENVPLQLIPDRIQLSVHWSKNGSLAKPNHYFQLIIIVTAW